MRKAKALDMNTPLAPGDTSPNFDKATLTGPRSGGGSGKGGPGSSGSGVKDKSGGNRALPVARALGDSKPEPSRPFAAISIKTDSSITSRSDSTKTGRQFSESQLQSRRKRSNLLFYSVVAAGASALLAFAAALVSSLG
jgi:hypothetical protein